MVQFAHDGRFSSHWSRRQLGARKARGPSRGERYARNGTGADTEGVGQLRRRGMGHTLM